MKNNEWANRMVRGTTLDMRFIAAKISQAGSAEAYMRNVPGHIAALVPIEARVPDEIAGSLYADIVDGSVPLGEAMARMDHTMVVHSDYAEAWLRHAWCDAHGYDRPLVAWAESMDLVAEHINVRDRSYDAFIDVLDRQAC